ncbi:hypothetical protein BH11PSE11_BH11PSE11_07660 [soil metagenome]
MKITIKLSKPRNPLVVAAKQRKAGAHGAYRPERHERRVEKQRLRQLLSGRVRNREEEGNFDE